MPDVLLSELSETIRMDMGAQDPWPQMITLYQPYEVEQILLPDNANCLAVQAFLKMCGLEFQVEPRSNAEYMSPSGRVPFIRCGAFLIPEFENIVSFIGYKGTSLSEHLDSGDKADLRAYMSLVNNVFINAELYVCWVHEPTVNTVTKHRYGSVYPWPLKHFLNWRKQHQVIKKLNVLGWYNKTLDEVFGEVKNCCVALSERLGDNNYFFGDKPTELDALVYGHVSAIVKPHSLPFQEFATIIRESSQLIKFVGRLNEHFLDQNNCDRHVFIEDFEIIDSPSKDSIWNFTESLESLPPLSEDSFIL